MGQPAWTTFFHVALVGFIAMMNLAASYEDFYESSENDQDGGLVTQSRSVCDKSFSNVQLFTQHVFYDDCSKLEDGYYADYNSLCHDYFRCHDGNRFNYSCGTTMQFDTVAASCKDHVHCQLPSCSTRAPNTAIVVPNTNCKLFIRCLTTHPSVHSCPPSSIFDTSTSSCVTITTSTVCMDKDPCSGRSDGCYPHIPSGCRKYLQCCNGTIISEQQCPPGEIFDATTNRCLSTTATAVSCSSSSSSSSNIKGSIEDYVHCSSKPDGYHVLPNSGCRMFQLCHGAMPASTLFQCPAGKAFDTARQCCWEKSSVECGNTVQDPVCAGKEDGYHPVLTSKCKTFFYCKNNRVTARLSCAKGRIFDPDVGHCTDESTGHCPRDIISVSSIPGSSSPGSSTRIRTGTNAVKCSGKRDGYYPVYEDNCQTYYYCQDSRNLVSLQCPSGTMFNEQSRSCVRKGIVSCKGGDDAGTALERELVNSRCWGRVDGLYADTLKGCKEYIRCRQGVAVSRMQCHKGHLFDSTVQSCVPSNRLKCTDEKQGFCWGLPDGRYTDYSSGCTYEYECKSGSTSFIPCTTSKSQCVPPIVNCTGVSDGYYPDKDTGSRSFYRCHNSIHTLLGHCLENLIFDTASSCCQPQQLATYPLSSMCVAKQNGFYPDRNTNCSRFYVCVEGKMVQTVDCPTGQVFDTASQSCLPATEASCLASPENKWHDCTDKFGFYADTKDNCRGFYVCLPGNQSLTYQCPTGQLYSDTSKKCEHESDVECADDPMEQVDVGNSFSCKDKPDGYYTDVGSGCRRWYECQSGDATAYQCPPDRVFNILFRKCDHPARVECADERWVFKNYTGQVQLVPQARTATDTPMATQTNCTEVPNGIYVNVQKGLCQSVSVCVNGESTYVQCPQELLTVKNCALPGIYVDVEDQCRSFNICSHGVLTSHRCPQHLIFNTKLRRCVRDSDDLCHNQPRYAGLPSMGNRMSLFKTPPDPESVPPPPFDCSGKPDGYYPDYEQECHVFYRCVRGQKFSHYCNVGLLFNPVRQNCDLQENVTCEEPEESVPHG